MLSIYANNAINDQQFRIMSTNFKQEFSISILNHFERVFLAMAAFYRPHKMHTNTKCEAFIITARLYANAIRRIAHLLKAFFWNHIFPEFSLYARSSFSHYIIHFSHYRNHLRYALINTRFLYHHFQFN